MESGRSAERDMRSRSRRWTMESAWAGLVPVPEPAVSSFAVTSEVLRRSRSSSLVSENMVWKVDLSISPTKSTAPTAPSALRPRNNSKSSAASAESVAAPEQERAGPIPATGL